MMMYINNVRMAHACVSSELSPYRTSTFCGNNLDNKVDAICFTGVQKLRATDLTSRSGMGKASAVSHLIRGCA